MRSLLFVPADSEKKLSKGLAAGADALILDLEDSVVPGNKPLARDLVRAFLEGHTSTADRPLLMVRVNALDSHMVDADLDAVVAARPDAIMLPKSQSGADVASLDEKLRSREATHGIADGHIKIMVVATETAKSVFNLGSYQNASPRLNALTWGAEDLSADVGSETNRNDKGLYTEPFRLVRSLCLFGAVAAGVEPIDSVFPPFRDLEGLRRECEEARRDGFTGKMAIHPAQVPIINEVFSPTETAIAAARAVVVAFAAAPSAGVINLNGEMLDPSCFSAVRSLLLVPLKAFCSFGCFAIATRVHFPLNCVFTTWTTASHEIRGSFQSSMMVRIRDSVFSLMRTRFLPAGAERWPFRTGRFRPRGKILSQPFGAFRHRILG